MVLMAQVAATQRFDAAVLLIDALSLHHDPRGSNDPLTASDRIPAIAFLKRYYGSEIAPIIISRAIASGEPWFQERCILAARTMGTPAQVKEWQSIFGLKDALPQRENIEKLFAAKEIEPTIEHPEAKMRKAIEDLKFPVKDKKD